MAEADPYNTGDAFTDSVLEESRRRRQTGIGGSTSPDIDYLNSPPYRDGGIGTRESTNVDDRRGQDWDKTQPMATKVPKAGDFIENPTPSIPMNAWTTAIRGARGFMETINDTLGNILNPQPTPEIDPGSEDAYARELLAQRGQGRSVADIAMGLAGVGSLAAVRAPTGRLGAFGGRLSENLPPIKIGDDMTLHWRPNDPNFPEREFVVRREGFKSAGEGGVWRDPKTGQLEITSIDLRGIQKEGTMRERLGPKTYDAIESQLGTLHPSGSLTEDSMRLWMRRNPEAVEGRYAKEVIDGETTYTRLPPEQWANPPKKTRLEAQMFPDQGSLPLDIKEAHLAHREAVNRWARDPKGDPTKPIPGTDPSLTYRNKDLPHSVQNQINRKLKTKAEDLDSAIKKEIPGVTTEVETSGTSRYIYVKNESGKSIGKFRVADHGATSTDVISIDPVSGNTIQTVLDVLKYERGLSADAPKVGWSLLPSNQFRKAINREAGMDLFPDRRQIGGIGTYQKGGYAEARQPYLADSQTIGTDIQWKFPSLLQAAE